METYNKIATIIIKYRKEGLNDQEQKELDDWIALSNGNRQTFEHLTDESYMKVLSEIDVRAERRKIKEMYEMETGEKFPIRNKGANYFVAAIIILICLGVALYFLSRLK
jgi:hypothetical protein